MMKFFKKSSHNQQILSAHMVYLKYTIVSTVFRLFIQLLTLPAQLINLSLTYEEFTDNNDFHFLDIKITLTGTTIYRKSTHTGQYIHLSSFTPLCRKVAWVGSLFYRGHKICSNHELLQEGLQNIVKLAF